MKLINKSRRTGKTTQLIYASAITGFRIIAPDYAMASYIEKMAKDMGLNIPQPMSDIEYRNRRELKNDHTPILIDELQNEILNEALELYFGAPVVAATMTVPIDDDCVPPAPKLLVLDHETGKVRMKTNRDVLRETFGDMQFTLNEVFIHLEDAITIRTEDGEDMRFTDWLDRTYVERKEENNDKDN